ncbi:MAG: hypothetical protein GY756_01840, partial [bacterium]|nr:hypothetical protein [bacterium]
HDYFEKYKRVIGPDGGVINFYANYANDSIEDIIATMVIPPGALDSAMVFNMHQFEDYKLAEELKTGYAVLGSKLLYFVPFPESEGYNEQSQFDINYHLSAEFNEPVRVTYRYLAGKVSYSLDDFERSSLYYEYYNNINRAYRLYRIKIPKTDEWGEENNIFIAWNSQGYPVGYNESELKLIVSGNWSQSHPGQDGKMNLQNWEQVEDIQINIEDESISFDIYDTDYMYVLAQVIQVDTEDLPSKIQWYISNNYFTEYIESASFVDRKYSVSLSNHYVLEFTQKGDFLKSTLEMYTSNQIHPAVRDSITAHFPDNEISFIGYIVDNMANEYYKIVLTGGISFIIDGFGNVINQYIYGYDESQLPADIKTYIETNHPTSAIINTVVKIDKYVVYLSDNKKLYFNFFGTWEKTLWYRYSRESLPGDIKSFMNKEFRGISELSISRVTFETEVTFEILLIDESYIEFSEAGVLQYMEIPY